MTSPDCDVPQLQAADVLWDAGGDRFRLRRREFLPTRGTDRAAAQQARTLQRAGTTVLLRLSSGVEQLYGREWAGSERPNHVRLRCPSCKGWRHPRARTCRACWTMTPEHRRIVTRNLPNRAREEAAAVAHEEGAGG